MTRAKHNVFLAALAIGGCGLVIWIMSHSIVLPRAVPVPMPTSADTRESNYHGESNYLRMGGLCDCQFEGMSVSTDQGPGKCLDGTAVKEEEYKKLSVDPKFEYKSCNDPRKVNDCKALGIPGRVTVIIDDDPSDVPSSMLLGIIGDAERYALSPGNENLEIWGQALMPAERHLMVSPGLAEPGLNLVFIPGYATRDNKDPRSWNFRCDELGCSGKYTVCSGLSLVGIYHHGISMGNCQNELSSMGVQEISCQL